MASVLVLVVVAAVVFDYINGFHDAANAIATVVSTARPGRDQAPAAKVRATSERS